VKVEYQYFDFGTKSSATIINTQCCSYNNDLTANVLKVGVNWRFGGRGWATAR
jgi:opacity protein-like surface antigen